MRLLTDHPEVDGIVCFSDVVAFGVLLPLAGIAIFGDQIRDILVEIGNSV